MRLILVWSLDWLSLISRTWLCQCQFIFKPCVHYSIQVCDKKVVSWSQTWSGQINIDNHKQLWMNSLLSNEYPDCHSFYGARPSGRQMLDDWATRVGSSGRQSHKSRCLELRLYLSSSSQSINQSIDDFISQHNQWHKFRFSMQMLYCCYFI